MELIVRAGELQPPVDWLVRSKHNSALGEGVKLWPEVTATEALGTIRFTMPSRQGKAAREVEQQVWAKTVQLRDGKGGFVTASCIVARETAPPAGEKAVEWRLLSNRAVATLEQAIEMIDWYRRVRQLIT